MITDNDITKLKTVFATKDDLKKFALKEDLKGFALKEDFADLKLEVGEINDKIDLIAGELHEMHVKYDRTIGGLDEQRIENGVQAIVMHRHERQIQALASGTGVKIPED